MLGPAVGKHLLVLRPWLAHHTALTTDDPVWGAGKPLSKWLAGHHLSKAQEVQEDKAVFVVRRQACSTVGLTGELLLTGLSW